MDDPITTAQASQILELTQRRIQQLINEGIILGQKFGDRWMVSESSVLEYKKVREQRRKKGQLKE